MDKEEQINPAVPMRFGTLREAFGRAALAGAVYTPFAVKQGALFGMQDLLQSLAVIGGIFMALRVPFLREGPLLFARLVLTPLFMRGRKHEPALQAVVDELLQQAGSGRKVTVKSYRRGVINNAAALGGDILVGKKLQDRLSPAEMKFVLAHELAHIEAQDGSKNYLFIPPVVDSIMTGAVVTVAAVSHHMAQGVNGLADLAGTGMLLGGASAYYGAAQGIGRYHSRLTEYRADAAALRLTRDFPAAVGALAKIGALDGDLARKPSRWQTWRSTHPLGRDRLCGLIRAHAETKRDAPAPS